MASGNSVNTSTHGMNACLIEGVVPTAHDGTPRGGVDQIDVRA